MPPLPWRKHGARAPPPEPYRTVTLPAPDTAGGASRFPPRLALPPRSRGLRALILGATALSGVCAWLAAPPGALAACTITGGSGTATAPHTGAAVNCTGTGLTTPVTAAGGSTNVAVTIGDGTTATALTTSANGAPGATVLTSSAITINGGATVSTTGVHSFGAYAYGNGNTLTISGGAISTMGVGAHGTFAFGSSNSITISGGAISTSGVVSRGAVAFGNSNTFTLSGGTISTSGNYSSGLSASGTSNTLTISGGAISTSGNGSFGAYASGTSNTLTISGGSVSTTGSSAHGFKVTGASNTLTISGGTISTTGSYARGASIQGNGNTLTISGGSISTGGNYADGVNVYGDNSTVTISGGSVSATGLGANAINFMTPNGGLNTLVLDTGASITGGIVASTTTGVSQLFLDGSGTLESNIANFQTLTKNGSGSWALGGTITGTTTATINAGTLALNGSIDGDVMVNSGGTLGGTGSIGGGKNLAVASGGTVAPGNSIGTLTVSGNYTPAAGSFYLVEINPTQSDKLMVTGTALLGSNGMVEVQPLAGIYLPNTPYTILSAGTLTGAFAGVTSLDAGFTFSLGYVGNSVILTLLTGGTNNRDASQAVFTQSDSAAEGTTITFAGGTLKLTGTTTLGQPITIQVTGATIDAAGNVTKLSGSIANAGNLTIKNTGGSDGTVAINGTLTGGTFTVDSTGVLRGTGTIHAPGTIFGTLRPGNSPGTLLFGASQVLGAGGTLALDIDGTGTANGAGNYSRVIVTGGGNSFTIGSNATIAPQLRGLTGSATNTYTPTIGTKFAGVVQAAGGIVGSFASLTQPSSGLATGTRFDTVYGSNAIDLYVTPAAYAALPAAGIGQTANQAGVGSALDRLRPAAGTLAAGDTKTLFDALAPLDGPGIANAQTQLAGSGVLNTVNAGLATNRMFGDAIARRQDQLRAGAASIGAQAATALPGFQLKSGSGVQSLSAGEAVADAAGGRSGGDPEHRFGTWVHAFSAFSTNSGDGNDPGFRSRTGGGAVGADYKISESFVVGISAGYARSSITGAEASGNADVNSYQVAGYGSWTAGPWFADGTLGYGYDQIDTKRAISFSTLDRTATGKTHGHDFNADIRGGYRLALAGYQIEPDIGLRYDRLYRAGFSESGAGLLNLTVGSNTTDALRSSVGGRVSRAFRTESGITLEPELRLHWQQDLLDQNARASTTLGGAAFTVETAKPGRAAAVVGVGLAAVTSDSLRLYANYDAERRANQTDHVITAGLRYTW